MIGDLRLGVSSCSLHDSVEAGVFVSGVFNNTGCSVGLNQAVGALDHVAVTGLPLALDVTSVRVVDGVVEFIVRWPLINKSTLYQVTNFVIRVGNLMAQLVGFTLKGT